jgi:DNA-directed RNA polymerase subunit alpha
MKISFEIKLMVLLIQRCTTEAAKVLIHHFMLFSDERITLEAENAQTESYDEESLHMRQLLKTKLVDMDLL